MPPVNRPSPRTATRRMSAEQALAPVRRPGIGRPPGAHIGDESERRAKIISFANQKGGVAKTTTTLNLAVAFTESGHDVLAIDLDPQGNLTMSQGIDPDKVEATMYDVLVDHIPIRDVIHEREIDIAVASIDLAGAEIAMSMQIGRERSLEKALSAVDRRLRLRLHRHPAEPRAAHRQRADGLGQGDRPRPVRISLHAGARPAPEHARDDPREPEPAGADRGDPADDARLADHPRQGGGGDPRGELRRAGLQVAHPQGDQVRRGAGPRARACSSTIRRATPPSTTASWPRRS